MQYVQTFTDEAYTQTTSQSFQPSFIFSGILKPIRTFSVSTVFIFLTAATQQKSTQALDDNGG